MSETNTRGEFPAGAVTRGEHRSHGLPEKEKLSKFMLISIYLLAFMGLGSGFLLLFGEFEGKFVRVFATLFLFVVFTAFVAKDTSNDKPFLALPIALAGNVYMLGLSLLLIWASLGKSSFDTYWIIPKLIALILAIKLATIVIQKISYLVAADQEQLSLAAKIAVATLGITAVLYTVPLGLDHLLEFNNLYWKLAVFSIIVSGITLSITSLLFWTFKGKLNPIIAAEFGSMAAITETHAHVPADRNIPTYGASTNQPKSNSVSFPAGSVRPVPFEPMSLRSARSEATQPFTAEESAPTQQNTVQAPPVPPVPPAAPASAPQAQAAPLPWPVFPNGTPIPAKADGTPDFEALEAVKAYINQQFGRSS